MPLYRHFCEPCQAQQDVFSKIADRDKPVFCASGHRMERRITAPMILPDYPGYESPATGKWVEGRKAHKEDLARSGCRLLEPGETAAFQQRRAREDEAFLDRIADSAAETVLQMPTAKREQLARELESGADVAYSRNTP